MQTFTRSDYIFQNSTNASLGQMIPMSIIQQKLMSGTSEAIMCFAEQGFSNKLQAYLINYVASVSSYYPLYA